MRVTRLRVRNFRSYESADVAFGAGDHGRLGPQRRRQDEPPRGALLRVHGALVPDRQRPRGRAVRGRGGAPRARGGGRPRRARGDGRLPARRGEAPARRRRGRGATHGQRRAAARLGLPPRSPRARARCPGAAARRISTRCSPRCGRRARRRGARTLRRSLSATRCSPRIRAGRAGRGSLPAWDAELARHGVELMGDRAERSSACGRPSRSSRPGSGSSDEPELGYRPRSRAETAEALAAELAERVDGRRRARLHRPRPAPRRPRLPPRGPRPARVRVAGPAAARAARPAAGRARRRWRRRTRAAAAAAARRRHERARRRRRERLMTVLRAGGQSVITTTDLAHVPGADARRRDAPRGGRRRGAPGRRASREAAA